MTIKILFTIMEKNRKTILIKKFICWRDFINKIKQPNKYEQFNLCLINKFNDQKFIELMIL